MNNTAESNLERMITLASHFFRAKSDPLQLSVNRATTSRLKRLHPGTMTEVRNKNGPIAWVLVIPTTRELMKRFIAKEIGEKDLLRKTPLNGTYDAVYLCSALVLPEYRGKGLAKRLLMKAVNSVRKGHPIKYLFYWGFSKEGKSLAVSTAKALNLPLRRRPD
ncbi:MAG TPA: GNAT family N-acetyltransferase [Bacteroidota bacterium]